MKDVSDVNREKAKEFLIKARLYRLLALCFALFGLGLFTYFYHVTFEGDFMAAIRNPVSVLTLLIPFVPAAVLSWRAKKAETRLFSLLDESDSSEDQKKTST